MSSVSNRPIAPPALPDFVRRVSSQTSKPNQSAPRFELALGDKQADRSLSMGGLTETMVDQVQGVNAMQTNAESMVHSLLTGGDVNESEVLTAVQKADLAFRMLMQIRNKLMDAYREIQQIQI